jgi:hypothetical protein
LSIFGNHELQQLIWKWIYHVVNKKQNVTRTTWGFQNKYGNIFAKSPHQNLQTNMILQHLRHETTNGMMVLALKIPV